MLIPLYRLFSTFLEKCANIGTFTCNSCRNNQTVMKFATSFLQCLRKWCICVWKRTFLWKYSTIYERCTETSFDICIWYYWHQFSKMFVFFKKTKYCVFCDMYRYTLCHQCQLYFCSMAKKSLKTKKRVCCIGFSIRCIRTTFLYLHFFQFAIERYFQIKWTK